MDPAQLRAVRRAVVRSLACTVLLLVLFYSLPLQDDVGLGAGIVLAFGLAVFLAVIVVQLLLVVRSDHPEVRAIQALATSLPLFLIVFATAYVLLDQSTTSAFTEPMNRTDALYFTVTVFSTVGFGDIAPVSQPARVATMVQMIGDLVLVGLVLKIFVGAVEAGRRRRAAPEDDEAG